MSRLAIILFLVAVGTLPTSSSMCQDRDAEASRRRGGSQLDSSRVIERGDTLVWITFKRSASRPTAFADTTVVLFTRDTVLWLLRGTALPAPAAFARGMRHLREGARLEARLNALGSGVP